MPVTEFDPDCVDAVRSATAELGYSSREMVSGAGHDALYVAKVAPTSMIFVPCKDGVSHNEAEDAKPDDLEAGCNVLLHAMLRHGEGLGAVRHAALWWTTSTITGCHREIHSVAVIALPVALLDFWLLRDRSHVVSPAAS